MMIGGQMARVLNRTEHCRGCDYFGNRSFASISSVSGELIPDDAFLRTFPFCKGKTPLTFSFWLAGLNCTQDDRTVIASACEGVFSPSDGRAFSTAPIIIFPKNIDTGFPLSVYAMTFHSNTAGLSSLCLATFPVPYPDDGSVHSGIDWSCLDFMKEAVVIAGPDARVKWANRVAMRELSPGGMQEGAPISAIWKRLFWGDDDSCPLQEFIPMCRNKRPKDIFAEDTLGRFWRIRTGMLGGIDMSSNAGFILTAVEMTEWMVGREHLTEMQNTLSAFMEHLPSSAVILDLEGKVQYSNARMKEFLRLSGCMDEDGFAFPPERIESLKKMFPEVVEKGFVSFETRYLMPENEDKIYNLTLFPIPHPGHAPLIGATIVDLTEERIYEEERLALLATLSEAQKAAHMGSWEYDDETGIITFRGICHETLAIRDQSVSLPLEAFLSSLEPDDASLVGGAVRDASVGFVPHELTISLKKKDCDVRSAALRARNRTDGIPGTVGTIQDVTERVKTERAHAESVERFRMYFNSNMSGSMIIEPLFSDDGDFIDFRYIAVNESFTAMDADNVFSEDTRKLVPLFYETVMQGGSATGEWTYSRNGSVFSGQIFRLGDIQPYYGCSFIDVSTESEALRVLQENDEFLSIIFPVTIEGIVVIDVETHTIQDLNATACELIGSGREGIIGRPCRDIICPVKEGLCPVTDLGEEVHMSERMLLRADGSKIPVLKSVKQVVYQGRRCLIEMIIDLRNVKAAEEALSLAEERYRMVFETSPDGIIITDTFTICEVNPAFASALGYQPEEMKGRSILDFAPEFQEDGVPSSERRDEVLEKIIREGSVSTPWDGLSRDGHVVRFDVRGSHVNLLGKTMVILVGRNVTELIQLKQRQREALDQIEENLGSLAILNDHIRNPLMVISAYTEMGESEHMPIIMDQIQEIDGIINTLDRGFLESEKIRSFLLKHHDVDSDHHNIV